MKRAGKDGGQLVSPASFHSGEVPKNHAVFWIFHVSFEKEFVG